MKSYFKSIHPVEDQIMEEYLAHWEVVDFPKRQVLTQAGQIQKHMYFVLEGIQKSYYLNNGRDHVIAFTYPPSFSGIPESFLTQTPSKYFLETISYSKFLRISYDQHMELMEKYRPIETLFRKATELLLIGLVQRYYELMAYDIETRFKSFVSRSHHLLDKVPHKDLASYLRIDATNFSKLLGNVKVSELGLDQEK